MARNDNKLFYGYIIIIASFSIILIMQGIYNTYGVFFSSLQAEFGLGRAAISGAQSLATFLLGTFAMVAGRLTDRFGPRVVATAFGVFFSLGFVLMSRITASWQLYLFYGVMAGIGNSFTDVTLLSTTARWFVKKRGMMSGIIKVGAGAGLTVMPLLASWFILTYGWRNSYLIMGLVSLVSVPPLARLLVRDPAQKGLEPYGSENGSDNGLNRADNGISLPEAVSTRQFWVLCVLYFLVVYCTQTVMIHIAPHTMDLGGSAAQAASILSVIGALSILGRLIMGSAGDRMGYRRALTVVSLVMVVALAWLQIAGELRALYLFAMVYGFAHGGFFALVSPLVAELFGMRSHGTILGIVFFALQTGATLGPLVTGLIFDATLSYGLAFLILLIFSISGLLLSMLLLKQAATQALIPAEK